MLKKILIILLSLSLLTGCRPKSINNEDDQAFLVLSLKGLPSLSLLCFGQDITLDTTSDTNTLSEAFDSNEKDIIIAPIKLGIDKCSNGNYKLLSIITYSTYQICSTDASFVKGDVGVYGELETILDKLSSSLSNYNFVYYNSLDDLKNALYNGEIESALLDEITYNEVNTTISINKIEELNSYYQVDYSYSEFPVYGMFVSNDVVNNYQSDLATFSRTLRNSISQYQNDKTTFNGVLENVNLELYGISDSSVISESYNYSGLCFDYAKDKTEELSTLLSLYDQQLDESIIVQ